MSSDGRGALAAVARVAFEPVESVASAVRRVAWDRIGWDRLVAAAIRHRVAPLLCAERCGCASSG